MYDKVRMIVGKPVTHTPREMCVLDDKCAVFLERGGALPRHSLAHIGHTM